MNQIDRGDTGPSCRLGQSFREPMDQLAANLIRAVTDHPRDVESLAALAEALLTRWCYGFVPRADAFPQAREAAEKAVSLDPDSALAQAALGVIRMADWDWGAAEHAFLQALGLAPDLVHARQWDGLFLAAMGRRPEALKQAGRALELEKSPGTLIVMGAVRYFGHAFQEQANVMEQAVAEAPAYAPAHDWLGMAYVQLGRFDDALRTYRKAVELADGAAEVLAGLGHACGVAGKADEALAIDEQLTACAQFHYVPPVQRAYVKLSLGQREAALALLEEAHEQRAWELVFAREEPWFDDQRDDPRFSNLITRLNLPPK